MKKLLLFFVKFVNNFTNEKLTPQEEAQSILTYLLWKSSVAHTLEVNEQLQFQLKRKMFATKQECISVIEKIDHAYPSESKIIHQLNL